jgi:RNA-binding protein Musashi
VQPAETAAPAAAAPTGQINDTSQTDQVKADEDMDEEDDDDDVDFNLGGVNTAVKEEPEYKEEEFSPPSLGTVHKASAKDDG